MKIKSHLLSILSISCLLFISLLLPRSLQATQISTIITSNANKPRTLFQDNFNNNKLNKNKWEFFDNGGSINFFNGNAVLSAGTAMPFIRAKNNPIPASGPFTIEFGIQYLTQAEGGNGVGISFTQQNNVADSNMWPNNPLALWQDNVGFGLVGSGAYILTISTSDLNYHIVKISYDGTRYSVNIDGSNTYTSPNTARVGGLWFGHPNYCCPSGGWSSFKLDYIKVTQP